MFPLFAAVDQLAQDEGKGPFDWASVDFVTDRNNLRKLLTWMLGKNSHKTSRLDLQLAGNKTIIIVANDPRTVGSGQGTGIGIDSYGFNFEKESTISYPGLESSLAHNRIIQYVGESV